MLSIILPFIYFSITSLKVTYSMIETDKIIISNDLIKYYLKLLRVGMVLCFCGLSAYCYPLLFFRHICLNILRRLPKKVSPCLVLMETFPEFVINLLIENDIENRFTRRLCVMQAFVIFDHKPSFMSINICLIKKGKFPLTYLTNLHWHNDKLITSENITITL